FIDYLFSLLDFSIIKHKKFTSLKRRVDETFHFANDISLISLWIHPLNKKFASLERRVGETLHVANDFVRCLSHCVGEVFQNLFYAQNQSIDITYIQKLSTFFKVL
ncbi:MAG: hypothetical protein SOR73_01905, partial [Romboutsia timonensis]|uniref:hypothetical protein n=1 Tax=Romboutsia timonensis TaxID=1776391 RepID=UPI002A748095